MRRAPRRISTDRRRRAWRLVLAGVALAACQPATTRPPFPPVPEAATTEVRLVPTEATRQLAEALRQDSIPVARVEQRDNWLATGWFDTASHRTTHRRPLGSDDVRIRAWSDPTRPGFSKITVETVYHPLADPSLPERELDRQVPHDHPVAAKVRTILADLVKRYGGPPAPTPSARPQQQPPDEELTPPADEEQPEPDQAPPQTE
jgi:hypothetical protein